MIFDFLTIMFISRIKPHNQLRYFWVSYLTDAHFTAEIKYLVLHSLYFPSMRTHVFIKQLSKWFVRDLLESEMFTFWTRPMPLPLVNLSEMVRKHGNQEFVTSSKLWVGWIVSNLFEVIDFMFRLSKLAKDLSIPSISFPSSHIVDFDVISL